MSDADILASHHRPLKRCYPQIRAPVCHFAFMLWTGVSAALPNPGSKESFLAESVDGVSRLFLLGQSTAGPMTLHALCACA